MALAVGLFGLCVAVLGGAGIVAPGRLLAIVTRTQSRLGLYLIAGFRLVVGGALLLAAPAARAPVYLQVLGALSVVSGALTPFVGVRRFEAILDWWRARPLWVVRSWSVFVLLFGLSLVWAVFPEASGSAFVAGLGVRARDFRLRAGSDLIRRYRATIRGCGRSATSSSSARRPGSRSATPCPGSRSRS